MTATGGTGETARTLVACLGNIFLSDDGFGVEVARRLARESLPEGVRVTDYGIRGMHLAYDLAEGFDTTILVDSAQRGDAPGTVYLIEPEPDTPAEGEDDAALARISLFNAHGMQPDLVLSLAGSLGGDAGRVLVVGCEPATLEEGIGLSAPVTAAVDEAVQMITRLVTTGQHASGRRGPRPAHERPGQTGWPRPARPVRRKRRGDRMCLGIPGEVIEFLPDQPDLARVDVSGVRRVINVGLLDDDPPKPGEWVLIHVGFALSKIDEAEAAAALQFLEGIGQAYADELEALQASQIE